MVELEKRMYVKSLPQCPAPGKGSVKSRCCQDGSGIQLSSQIHHKLRSCVTNDTKGGGNHGKNSTVGDHTVQFSSVTQLCPTLCDPMNHSMPGLPIHHQLPEFTKTHVHRVMMPSSHLILCRPLFLLPPIPPSIRVFPNESALCIRWPKYWSFSLSISPSKEYPGLISFRMDWLDFLAVQGTLRSLLQHHSSKASVLQCSAFFIVQLSHPYMTTGKTIASTR